MRIDRPMWTRQRKRRNTGALIVPALAALFLSYFGYHAFEGDYGIYAKYRLEERVTALQARLGTVAAERVKLERRVQRLHDGSLERDIVDELARHALDLAQPEEVIILRRRNTD